jgi:hypothetical protein
LPAGERALKFTDSGSSRVKGIKDAGFISRL